MKAQNQVLAGRIPTCYLDDGNLGKMIRLGTAFDNAFNKPLRNLDFGSEDIDRMVEMRDKTNPLVKKYSSRALAGQALKEFDTKPTPFDKLEIPEIKYDEVRSYLTGPLGLKMAPFYIHHSEHSLEYRVSTKDPSVIEVAGNKLFLSCRKLLFQTPSALTQLNRLSEGFHKE